MRRALLAFVVILFAGVLIACEPTPTGFTRVECVTGANNGSLIQNALNDPATTKVHLTGICTLDWRVRTGDTRYRVGFQIPNNHTVMLSGGVVLRPNQQDIIDPRPTLPNGDPNPNYNKSSTLFGDMISNLDPQAEGIQLLAGPVDGGIVDGQAASQPGNGFDGIHIFNCQNCLIEGIVGRNIRGLDTAGGATESGVMVYQNCRGDCVMRDVEATSSSPEHRMWTSSGIGANGGTGVDIIDSRATQIEGRGIAVWKTHDLYIENGFVHQVDAHSYGFEYSNSVQIHGAWASASKRGGLVIHDTSGLVADGLVLNPQSGSPVNVYTITLRNETGDPLPCAYNSLAGDAWVGNLGDYEEHDDALCQVNDDNLAWH